MKNIEDVEKPEIGKFYSVPHVLLDATNQFWPIIGNWHEDADIGTARYHFHYDARFLSESKYYGPNTLGKIHAIWNDDKAPLVVRKRRKMLREMPDFPHAGFIAILDKKFAGQKLKCMKCPHRGMDLKGLPVKDGAVLCNGHGLKWNVETGDLIKR